MSLTLQPLFRFHYRRETWISILRDLILSDSVTLLATPAKIQTNSRV